MKKKLLLIAYRAYGDFLYLAPVLPFLFDKYEVYLETNRKGFHLFHNDPRFKEVLVFEFEKYKRDDWDKVFPKRWKAVESKLKPDVVINMNGTLEVECIGERFQTEFWYEAGERRPFFGRNGFYDSVFRRCGMEVPRELSDKGIWFSDDEEAHTKAWADWYKKNFTVIIPIAGSTAQKVFHNYLEVTEEILDKYPEAVVFLAGDGPCSPLVPDHPRIKNICGERVSIKQAVHLTKYANMVIGPETFLLVAAGMFGTPKIFLATTSSVWQMTQYHKNDFSIQAPIHCSPCHRSIYFEDDCESPIKNEKNEFVATKCSKMFRTEDILQRVDYVYNLWKEKKRWDHGSRKRDIQ